jgi:hypothetical protein
VAKRADDEPDQKPVRKRPAAEDDDVPDEKPARKGAAFDFEDDEDDRPSRKRVPPKKSGKGKVLIAAAAALLLLCGGAVGGTYWVAKKLLGAAEDAVAQMTGKQPPDDGGQNPLDNNGLDVRFVADDFFAGAVVNAPSVLKAPAVASAIPPELLDGQAQASGIDLRKVERLVLLADPTLVGDHPPGPAVIFHFAEPVDGQAVLGKALHEPSKASFEGKSYFVDKKPGNNRKPPDAGYVADEQTLLIAPEPMLKKMLSAKGDGPLAREMRRLDLKADASAAFVMEPVRAKVGELLAHAKDDLPPDFADLATLHERLKTARLTLRLEGETLLTLTLEADSDASAEALEKLLNQGHGLLKKQYPGLRKEFAAKLPAESSKDALAVADQLPEALSVARDGKQVTAKVKMPRGLDKLGPALMPLIFGEAPAGEWKTFTSREQGFSASFPGQPEKTARMASGSVLTEFQLVVVVDGGVISYLVVCEDTAADLSASANVVFAGLARQYGKDLKSRRDVTIKGYPGVELVAETDAGGVPVASIHRAYVVKKRTYQIRVRFFPSKKDVAQPQKFLDSFALLEDDSPVKPPQPDKPGDSLKGTERAVMDVSAVSIKLPSKTTLPCLTWADDKGSAFYALSDSGLLRRVSFPDLKEEWHLDLRTPCSWLSLSGEGLLVTAGGKEVWLIDPDSRQKKGRFVVPGVKRAASVLGSDLAVAATGTALYVLDLKKITATKFAGPGPKNPGYDDPVMTADRKYVIAGASGQIHRYALADGQLRYEDSSAGVVAGRVDSWVTVSPDGKQVCYPSYNGGGTGKINTLAVFAVDDLGTPQLVLDPAGTAIGFDPAGGYICTDALKLYDDKGKFLKSYNLSGAYPRQILAHPAGGIVLVFTDDNITAVTLPKK